MKIALAALALASVAGCSFDFNNPAEKLHSGQVLGRAVGDASGTGALGPIPGVMVALQNEPSWMSQATRENGRFVLLSMPTGRHTVLFRKGTTWALQRDVEIGFGRDGQIEGVNLGDVQLRYTIELHGTFTLPAGFTPAPTGALALPFGVTDEVTGASAALSSGSSGSEVAFSFLGLPVGPHRIRAVAVGSIAGVPATFSGLRVVTIADADEGKSIPLAGIDLSQETSGGLGHLQGHVAIVAPRAVPVDQVQIELHDASAPTDPFLVTSATLLQSSAPDSTGFFDVEVAASAYKVRLVPPTIPVVAGESPIFLEAPQLLLAVVQDGEATDVGTLYAVDSSTGASMGDACFDDGDCAPTGTCVNGFCSGSVSTGGLPPVAPFCIRTTLDIAQVCMSCALGPTPCATAGGVVTGYCDTGGYVGGPPVCMPVGALWCTTDGVDSFSNTGICQ